MNQGIGTLDEAAALLASIAELPLASLTDEDACAFMVHLEQVGRYVDSLRALSAADIDDRSRFGLGNDGLAFRLGHRRGIHLIEQLTRVSDAEAAKRIRLGEAIRPRQLIDGRLMPPDHPHVAEAMTGGTMAADAAAAIVRCLDQAARHHADPGGLDDAEKDLAANAAFEPADNVAIRARVWREVLDPDGAAPRDEELRERRGFRIGREAHGLTQFSGACHPTFAAKLRAVFSEATAPGATPRFLSIEDEARGTESVTTENGETYKVLRDVRTREQRQLDILEGLVTAGMRSRDTKRGGTRSTATVMAVIQLEDLENGKGVGWLDDIAEPVSATTVRELVCDAGYRPIVMDGHGAVLYEGDLQRYFTPAQRRALYVRDGGCVWNGCSAPPDWCDAHHVEEVAADNGKTDINNGVLFCPAHHHMFHASAFRMKMINGMPHMLAPLWIDPGQTWRPVGRSRVTMARKLKRTG